MIKPFIFALFSLALFGLSCRKNGGYTDTIKLSQNSIDFDSSASRAVVTTQSRGWWLNNIDLNGKKVDLSDVDRTAQNFIVVRPEFTLERVNGKKIVITVSRNESGSERTLIIALQAGDYFDGIRITQSDG